MSYEGANHKLCPNGHYHGYDALEEMYESAIDVCPDCGSFFALEFCQDQTNGEDPEEPHTLHPELVVIQAEESQTCNLGHYHTIKKATYKPKDPSLWHDYRTGFEFTC